METPTGIPDLPGVDKEAGLQHMLGKPTLYEKVLRDFHLRFRDEALHIAQAIQAGDFPAAGRRVHSAKGLAGTIGAHPLHEASRLLEIALSLGKPLPEGVFERFETELQIVIGGIAAGFGIS